MTNRIVYSLYSLVYLTLVLVPNAVLCNHDFDILNRAIPVTRLDRLQLPPNTVGAESTAFDPIGVGPYTSVSNGRVLKWTGPLTGFVDFAITSQNWSRQVCVSKDMNLEPVCGRPLSIEFYKKKDIFYITDAYYNLRSVGSNGGLATLLASSAEGVRFKFTSGMDVDQETGIVYLIDSSTQFQLKELDQAVRNDDMTGRLMRYDPTTKQVTVLLRNLALPAGVAISKDKKFVLVTEYAKSRIVRYWIKGPKVNTSDIFFSLPSGLFVNIRRNKNGNFWLAVSIGTLQKATPLGILVSKDGKILRTLNFTTANISILITDVHEFNRKLYIGSLGLEYVGVTKTTRG